MGVLTRALSSQLPVRNSRSTAPGMTATARILNERRVGKADAKLYRDWSIHSPWVRAAFDIRIGQLQRAEYDLVPYSLDLPKPDKGLMRRMHEILDQPNPGDSSFSTLIGAVGEDIMALDAGAIEKERMVRGEIAYLWPTDGASIKVDRFWTGNPREPRYYWCPEPRVEIPLLNSDLIYQMLHRRSYSPVGVSYLETLRMTIEADLAGGMFNARQVMNAAPDGVMDMGENARKDQVDAFSSFFGNEIAGKGVMAFWGGTKGAKFIDFHKSNTDMQFMEWLVYLVRQMAAVIQLSPQDLGLMFDVNKSSGEVQQENTENRGQKTLLGAVQDYMTAEFCWDPAWGGAKNNIAFRFRAVTNRQSKGMAETQKLTLAGMPSQSINEARKDQGLPPIGDPNDESNPYNQLMANTSQGLVRLEDIPTARELAMRPPPAQIGPGGDKPPTPAAKSADPDLLELKSMARETSLALATMQAGLTGGPPAAIAEGAVKVQFGSDRLPDQTVSRETTFQTDGRGRIMSKTEVETIERPAEQVVVDQKLVELKQAELEAAQRRAAEPAERAIVRETEFEINPEGVVIRKVETEHGDQ